MPMARNRYVSLDATPYYHCIGRCVRRAFLWGKDDFSGRDFSHRKAWVIERLRELSEVFSISICAYAIMSNHYHLVLHVDRERTAAMSDAEVVERWQRLFSLPLLLQNFLKGDAQDAATRRVVDSLILELRSRLHDLSWYMRCLNESIARRANAEDDCTGRFWEGRFKSQAILDEAGLLACCAYVDLNPIRAGMVDLPEQAEYTSIQQRIRSVQVAEATEQRMSSSDTKMATNTKLQPIFDDTNINIAEFTLPLHPFGNSLSVAPAQGLPCSLQEYVELVDWAARIVRSDKSYAMPGNTPPILTRLGFTPEQFQQSMQSKAMSRGSAIGQIERLKAYAAHLQKRCVMGVGLKVPILNGV
ncbi:transposase [Undibacterium seohonense]|uniref:Transposase n=1 Tax=Undibacterium seohonense TaxID=1344950 RepID=A0ABR6WZH5_9BURK|nr:transposase [Undibacterium seohonense]MBC3806031.1 transposase [Undibacterium seohonense]